MKCDVTQTRWSDYVDGSLPAAERADLERHLGSCLTCRRLVLDLERLARRVDEWDPERSPSRDLWPAIEARLGGGERLPAPAPAGGRGFPRRWALAAAAVLVVGLAVPVAVERLSGPALSPERRALDRQAYEVLLAAASQARVADGTLQPRRDLEELLASHRDRLDDETLAGLELEADRLQRAIGELYLALEQQPDNRRLRLQLAARYRQESDLLQQLGRV